MNDEIGPQRVVDVAEVAKSLQFPKPGEEHFGSQSFRKDGKHAQPIGHALCEGVDELTQRFMQLPHRDPGCFPTVVIASGR